MSCSIKPLLTPMSFAQSPDHRMRKSSPVENIYTEKKDVVMKTLLNTHSQGNRAEFTGDS